MWLLRDGGDVMVWEPVRKVVVELVMDGHHELRVDRKDSAIEVVAHAGLSRHQVRAACDFLGDEGPLVLSAWEAKVGL